MNPIKKLKLDLLSAHQNCEPYRVRLATECDISINDKEQLKYMIEQYEKFIIPQIEQELKKEMMK